MKPSQCLLYFFQLAALIIFCIQCRTAIHKYLSNQTVVSITNERFQDIEELFLKVWLCPQTAFNETVGKNHGFYYVHDWYFGSPMLIQNQILFNWVGKQNLSLEEIKAQLFPTDFTRVEVTRHLKYPNDGIGDNIFQDPLDGEFLPDAGLCKVMDGSRYFSFYFRDKNNYKIFISDRKFSSFCSIPQTSFSGDPIENELNEHTKFYTLRLEITDHNKQAGDCMDYGPGNEFESHAACERHQLVVKFQELLGCVVPWVPSNNPCSKTLAETTVWQEYNELLHDIFHRSTKKTGCEFAACLKPCRQLKVLSKLTEQQRAKSSRNVYLEFDHNVKILKHEIAYGMFELIVDVGSSLGLWLGLTFIGMLDGIGKILSLFKRKTYNKWKAARITKRQAKIIIPDVE